MEHNRVTTRWRRRRLRGALARLDAESLEVLAGLARLQVEQSRRWWFVVTGEGEPRVIG